MFGTLRKSDLRAGQERVDTHDVDGDATLDLAGQHTLDGLVRLVGLADSFPHPQEVGLLLGEHDDAVLVLKALDKNLDLLAWLDGVAVLELVQGPRPLHS